MFEGKPILIVEDETLIGMALADAVEDLEGQVVGPLATVREALEILDREAITAAILDAKLLDRDVTPVANRLIDARIPFVVHTGTGLPAEIATRRPDVPLLMKPMAPEVVAACLIREIRRFERI